MPIYHYRIRNRAGSASEGYREARDEGELRQWFERRGALLLSVREAGWLQQQKLQLSDQSADQLLRDVADAQAAGLPLDVALQSVAEVTSDRALARALRRLAERIGAGLDWQAALDELELPPAQRAILTAASTSRRPPEIILEVLEIRQWLRELYRSIWQTMAYPLACLIGAIVCFCVIMLTCVSQFAVWIEEFNTTASVWMELTLWWSQFGAWLLLGALGSLLAAAVITRWLPGTARWHLFVMTLPVFGPLFQYAAMIPLLRLASLMLRQHMPLGQALSLAIEASGPSANVRNAKQIVEYVSSGVPLADGLAAWGPFPRVAIPLIRWSEAQGCLTDGFDAAADYLVGMLQFAAQGVRTVLVPLVVFITVSLMLTVFSAIISPLWIMIRYLASG